VRVFPGELFDPEDAVTVFQKWFDQQNIGAMLSDELACLKETMRAAADLIPLIAPDNRGQAGLAYAVVSDHDDPTWLSSRANCRAIFYRRNGAAQRCSGRPPQSFCVAGVRPVRGSHAARLGGIA